MHKTNTLIPAIIAGVSVLVFLLSGLGIARAEPRIYLDQGLDFGRVIPRTGSIKIVLDALGDLTPACQPGTACEVSGGHPAVLYFYDFGVLNIRIDLPTNVSLYTDEGVQGAQLRHMHMYSHDQPFVDGTSLKAYLGGELLTGTPAYGKDLSGVIYVEVTTY